MLSLENFEPVRALPFMRLSLWLFLSISTIYAATPGGRVEYVGGTATQFKEKSGGRVLFDNEIRFRFQSKGKTVEVPYEQINVLEYGQKVDRRYLSAVFISPLMILAKTRKHFLTLGYEDAQGRQQAMVFRVEKSDIRAILVSLEARTGRKIQFQDDDARKAGKG